MKNIKNIVLILIISIIIIPINANAKTLGQLKSEYNQLEQKYNDKKNEKKNNEAQSATTSKRIDSIYVEISQAGKDIEKLNKDIEALNKKIDEKSKQVKDLMRFFQVSEGDSTYLEYIFSAESITDFIYRLSVTEQLSTYNNKLISDMHNMIKENKDNIENLHKKEASLEALQVELKQKLVVLSEQHAILDDEEESIEKDIKYNKQIIDYYIKSGCKESEDINTCVKGQLPADTSFWRPLQSGTMWSTWYSDVLTGTGGKCRSHAGVDISANYGTPIYAVAAGKVSVAAYSSDGYGNKVVIQHNINGKVYTTLYGHMSSIKAKKGDVVTKDTVIGYVGSTGRSQGNHLHLNICEGTKSCILRGDTVDPGNYINFPANKRSFSNRTTAYSGYYSDECHWRK